MGKKKSREPELVNISTAEKKALLERIEQRRLADSDYELISGLIKAIVWINQTLLEKKLSIRRLLRLFGHRTEKSSSLFSRGGKKASDAERNNDGKAEAVAAEIVASNAENDVASAENTPPRPPAEDAGKGHGRLGCEAYTGADVVCHAHESLRAGDVCPLCGRGKLHELEAGKLLRISGSTPFNATTHRLERLRCATCGEVFTAELPKDIAAEKYDAKSKSLLVFLRYGMGMPHYRLAKMQRFFGVPFSEGSQWAQVEEAAKSARLVWQSLRQLAARGKLIFNDDTKMRVAMLGQNETMAPKDELGEANKKERRGIFTTGIVSLLEDGKEIVLFFTGKKHAGENLGELLKDRPPDLAAPVQMCDGLLANIPKALKTIVGNCLTHARRNFVNIFEAFPKKCEYVLGRLAEVYRHDDLAKRWNMTDDERLRYHQQLSGPIMDELYSWFEQQIRDKEVEPNSGMGKAIKYMQKRWHKLTLFLRVAGAPLTSDLVERALKTAITHRKNSLTYRTEVGARTGDIFMSIIQTCMKAEVNPVAYMETIISHSKLVALAPDSWLPWNYQAAVLQVAAIH